MQFFAQIGLKVLSGTRRSENVVSGDSRVEPLQLGYPEPALGQCSCRNFSEEFEVVRVQLLKHPNSASCPHNVNSPGHRVKFDIVGATYAVQQLNDFPRFRIHDTYLSSFILLPPS